MNTLNMKTGFIVRKQMKYWLHEVDLEKVIKTLDLAC